VTPKAQIPWAAVAVLACTVALQAGDKKDKPKPVRAQEVDSGSFGVFVKGQRVVTENRDCRRLGLRPRLASSRTWR